MVKLPDEKGFFGEFGGSFVPPMLEGILNDVKVEFNKLKDDPKFNEELDYYFKHYVGRPSPLYFAEKLTKELGGCKIYLNLNCNDKLN